MSVNEFICDVLTCNSVDDILNKYETQSEKGFVFERLWDISIKFGFCDLFPRSQFTHMIGNMNVASLKPLTSFKDYLEKPWRSGNSGGSSDITLLDNSTGTLVCISSKFPKTTEDVAKQKSVSYYETEKIDAVMHHHRDIYMNHRIMFAVPDTDAVLEKAKNANKSSQHITKHMKRENFLDKNDLNKCFLRMKAELRDKFDINVGLIGFDQLYMMPKDDLRTYFHQELISDKTIIEIKRKFRRFLWGCKCRSGKTYMVGRLVIKLASHRGNINVLVITPVPTETISQFTHGLFNKFKDFDKFSIHNTDTGKSIKDIVLGESNIFVMSKHLLQNYTSENVIAEIKDLGLDLICFDENHFGGTTEISKEIITSYSSENTVELYLTATYNKPLKEWNIPSECQFYWDIEDEQICKQIAADYGNINRMVEKHGENVLSTVEHFTNLGYSTNEIFASYLEMPDLCIFTTMFESSIHDQIQRDIMGSKYGFCFDTLFTLNKDKTALLYEREVSMILRYISGSHKLVDFKKGDKSVLSRINKMCNEKNSRIPFTQIWFLPPDNINSTSISLKKLMEEDPILKTYEIMCVNRSNKELAKDTKLEISNKEKIAKTSGKTGLILLAGSMLNLGITLDLCDVVIMLNNSSSSDKIMQQMFRSMTQGENKKFGFVVDMNINRVLNTCINYSVNNANRNVENKLKYMIENHLINIDPDMMEQKQMDSDAFVAKLMEIWKADPVHSFKSLLQNLDNDHVMFDESDQKMYNQCFTSAINDDAASSIYMKDDGDALQELPSGIEVTRESSNTATEESKTEKELAISFIKDVLPYIIPLVCILTIKSEEKDILEMINLIENDSLLLEIFDDVCMTWWNKKNLIRIIKQTISKYFDKSSNAYNISITFKMSLRSLIDSPAELITLINDCLKPKEVDKKKHGEVFTPIVFANKMLDELANHYRDKYGKNIFEDGTLKWGDITAGMGNFPIALYFKLMDGLSVKFPNEVVRKKHIIENMLYMAELTKKNCFIIKQVFNVDGNYKLNLYEGDSLKLDIKMEWGIDKFDVCIGNPPYNKELKSTGATAFYNEFIEFYIDKSDLLSFIIPSRWFSGGKGLDSFRKKMLARKDIVYINHNEDASKIFGNLVDIKGGVNFFLKDKNYNGLCDFNGTMTQLDKYEVFVSGKYYSIIDKLSAFNSIKDIFMGRCFGIETNDKRLVDDASLDRIKCFVSQQKGFEKYISKQEVTEEYNYWKVITAEAAHEHGSGFGNTFIGNSNEVHSGSYISFKVDDEARAKSLLSYMRCRLPNFMLSLRKCSQHINKNVCKWIPLPPLNKTWTDQLVYEHFNLSEEEIQLIENTPIDGYKPTINNSIKLKIRTAV